MGNFAENLNLGNRFRPPLNQTLRVLPGLVFKFRIDTFKFFEKENFEYLNILFYVYNMFFI